MQKRKVKVKEQQQQLQRERSLKKAEIQKAAEGKKFVRLLALVAALYAFVLYINTLGHGFVLDDYSLILENTSTKKGFNGLGEIFTTSYRHGYLLLGDALYRPLSKALFAINWQLWPGSPVPGHWMNVLVFALTGFILMIVLHKYFRSASLAFAASLLFIAHPIHTEVVANIKSLDELLSLFFGLLTLNAIYEYCSAQKLKYLAGAFAFFFLAMISKESSVTFLGVFVISRYFFFRQNKKAFLKVFGATMAAFVIFMMIRSSVVGNVMSLDPSVADNFLMSTQDKLLRLTTAIYIMGLYVLRLLVPHPLAFDYSYNQIPLVSFSDVRFLAAILFFVAVTIIAIIQAKRNRIWAFGWFFFLITASVSSNIFIIIGTSMGERLMYAPSLGYCIAFAGGLSLLLPYRDAVYRFIPFLKSNRNLYIIVFLIVAAYSLKTFTRNPVWESNYTLYSRDVITSPNSTRTHYYLGNLLIKEDFLKDQPQDARDSILRKGISELEKSVAIYPSFTDAWNQMGVAYWRLQDNKNARRCYEIALKLNPSDPSVHNNLGTILFQTGFYEQALQEFRRASTLKPDYSDAWANAGSVLGTMSRFNEAVTSFEQAVAVDPRNATAWHYLGITWQSLGNANKAEEAFAKERQLTGQ